MQYVLCNAFSLNMLPHGSDLSTAHVAHLIQSGVLVANAIGHSTTDDIVRHMLELEGCTVPPGERSNVTVGDGHDKPALIVAQYDGPRLAEGTTVLPEGARIKWFVVYLPNP